MSSIIKFEIKRFFKSKKNLILIGTVLIILIGVNIMNKNHKDKFVADEMERLNLSFAIAQEQARKIRPKIEINRNRQNQENIGEELKKKLEVEEVELTYRQEVFNKEASRVNMILSVFKDIEKDGGKRRGLYTEEERNQMHQKYTSSLLNLNIEAYEKGYINDELLDLRKTSIHEYNRELFVLNYIEENEIEYNINPHTNTGINLLSKILENNIIMIIFVVLGFMMIDVFLSEVGEGSYKLIYTQPYERKDIFFGKIISTFLILTIMFLMILGVQFLVGTLSNGIGEINAPYAVSENLMKLSLSNDTVEFKMIDEIKSIGLSILLIISVILLNIGIVAISSIYTDSMAKTISLEIVLILFTLIIRSFIPSGQIIHGINPISYIFTHDIMTRKLNSSYPIGIILNIGLSIILLILSYQKFNNKDFLGAKE